MMYQIAALLPPEYRGVYANLDNATQTYLRFDRPEANNQQTLKNPDAINADERGFLNFICVHLRNLRSIHSLDTEVHFPTDHPQELTTLGWMRWMSSCHQRRLHDSPFIGVAVGDGCWRTRAYRVGVIAQPDIHSADDITRLGTPRLFWGVTGGSIDSMVANYTATKKRRKSDDYTPAAKTRAGPDRAVIVYTNLIKQHCKPVSAHRPRRDRGSCAHRPITTTGATACGARCFSTPKRLSGLRDGRARHRGTGGRAPRRRSGAGRSKCAVCVTCGGKAGGLC
jgi:hypothetical protein